MNLDFSFFADSRSGAMPTGAGDQYPNNADYDAGHDAGQDADLEHNLDTTLLTRRQPKTAKPAMYRVIMHNDDYTIMEFVVAVLIQIFQKSKDDARRIMLQIHREGQGTAGLYTYDIARSKVQLVHQEAKAHEFPLRCTIVKESDDDNDDGQ